MANVTLFLSTVVIWGTTWIAIAMQIGPVPELVSVFYRFALAAAIMIAGLALAGRLKLPRRDDWPWLAVQAACLFCFNFICFYYAAASIPSGLEAVIFSLASIFNAVNARIFFGDRISGRMLAAGLLGVAGVVLLFADELVVQFDATAVKGMALAIMGTLFFSLGNMVSRRNNAAGISLTTANCWGMCLGALLLLVLVLVTRTPMVAPPDARYVAALVYLALFGSVIAFTTYLALVKRVGSSRAGYATVFFPVVALAMSTLFEGYQWHWTGIAGLGLTIIGNLVMFGILPRSQRGLARG